MKRWERRMRTLSFNQTKMELKPQAFSGSSGVQLAFNQTKMELKPVYDYSKQVGIVTFNQTKMELKLRRVARM